MSDTSNCSNYMPSAFHHTVGEYPHEGSLYMQPLALAHLEPKGLLSGSVSLFVEPDTLANNPGVLIKYDPSLPNGYELSITTMYSGWGGFYLFVEDAQGNHIFANSNVDGYYPNDYYQLPDPGTVRLMVMRDPGVETGDYRWYLIV